jgi:hypothetical protein
MEHRLLMHIVECGVRLGPRERTDHAASSHHLTLSMDDWKPASRPGRTIRTRTRRSLDVLAGRLVRLTPGMFA